MQRLLKSDETKGTQSEYNSDASAFTDRIFGENLMAALRRVEFGNDSQILKTAITDLSPHHLPCVAVLKSGNGIIIRHITGKKIEIQESGQISVVNLQELLPVYSGSVIVANAGKLVASLPTDDEKVEPVFHPSLRNIFFIRFAQNIFSQ